MTTSVGSFHYPYRWPDLELFRLLGPDADRSATDEFNALQETRDRALEDFLAGLGLDRDFVYSGTLSVSNSPRYYPRYGGTLSKVFVSLDTAGTSNTVVDIGVNGSSIGTVTLGSGVHTASLALSKKMRADSDYLKVSITTVGTGSPKDLNAQLRFG